MKELPKRKKIRLPHAAYCDGQVFFITIGTYERYPWFHLYPELTGMSMQLLREIAVSRRSKLYAWCFMPDHVHLLLQDTDVLEFVRLFKGKLAPAGSTFEPARRLWQRSFYDKGLRKEDSLEKVALYIWENPVRAGTVKSAADYAWIGSGFWPDWKEYLEGDKPN